MKSVFFCLFIWVVCLSVCVCSLCRGAICKEYDGMHVFVCVHSLSDHRWIAIVFLTQRNIERNKLPSDMHRTTHMNTYTHLCNSTHLCCVLLHCIHYIFSLIAYFFLFTFSSIVVVFPYSASCPIIVRFLRWYCVLCSHFGFYSMFNLCGMMHTSGWIPWYFILHICVIKIQTKSKIMH